MESRTLRYRTNVPFCNACSKKRDSHREVILILKLAYRTNLSGWKLFFSCEIFLRDHRKIVGSNESREMWRQIRCHANQTFCQEKWNDKFQSTCSQSLCFTTGAQDEKYRTIPISRIEIHRITNRIVDPSTRTRFFSPLVEIKEQEDHL